MITATTTTSATARIERSPDDFDLWADMIRRCVAAKPKTPLFMTAPEVPLFDVFLDSFGLPAGRQVHNCNCCRHFLERFGGLVTISDDGVAVPFFWQDQTGTPWTYGAAQSRLSLAVSRAPVTGVFLSSDTVLGDLPKPPKMWTHFQVYNPALYQPKFALDASQATAIKLEEHGMVERGLAEYSIDVVRQAVAILKTEQLYRSEKVLGVAEWLLKLHESRDKTKNQRHRDNLVWLATATAPVGFAHVRSSMIGTLLDDLASGMVFETVKRRFGEKMNPLQYRRPTAAPTEGNIAQAEKLVAAMGIESALARRFAKLEDLVALWKPRPPASTAPATGGVFDHLRVSAKTLGPIDVGASVTMTWDKFERTVLPTAEAIECSVPTRGNFLAFITAVDPNAAPIVQWDRAELRNPVTWYVYHGGSMANDWDLGAGMWVRANAIVANPAHWDKSRPMPQHKASAVFVLEDAKDMRHRSSGGMFIENLKSEYNAVRATLEAHFLRAPIAGRDESTASGLVMQAGGDPVTVRVTSNGIRTMYKLDRWD